jgi:hypothetical protein
MNVQYISDNLGNKTAVIIPINEWEKIPKKYRDTKKEEDPFSKEMTQEEFVQWIEDAEKSPTMSLEEFNAKWEQKKQQIRKLIP